MDAVRTGLTRRFRFPRVLEELDARTIGTFGLYALPFFVTALGYELLRSLMGLRGEVHVGDLYALEERLFPVHTADGVRALSEVVSRHTHALLDVVCGAAYLLFLVEFFVLAAYFFVRDRPRMLQASLGFLLVNAFGWAIWIAYPAAPPWYVDTYGTGPAVLDAASSPAGLSRLDALLGLPISAAFYAKSANVFGAMPSLHVTYAVLIALLSWPLRGATRIVSASFAITMIYSSMYLRHHYLLDAVAGIALAVLVFGLVTASRRVLERRVLA